MANKNIEGYALHCPTALKKKYKKLSGMKDFIGFLVFRHYGYENYRNANNGWFFVSTADFIKENVVGSKTTLHKYETKLRQDGLIEKKTGDFSERKANEYRLLFNPSTGEIMTDLSVQFSEKSVPMENPLETALRNVKGCTDKCTDNITDNEEVNEKSVPMIFPKKCTTDTDTLTEEDIYKTSITLKGIDTGDKSNVMESTEEKTEKLKEGITLKSDSTGLYAFKWDKLLSEYVERRELLPYEQRKAAREWYNKAWKRFMSAVTNRNLSWREILKHFKSFMEWLVVITNNKETYTKLRQSHSEEYCKKGLDAFFEDYGEFIDEVKTDYLNDSKRYSKNYKSYRNFLQDIINGANTLSSETREKVLFKVDAMYNEAIEPQLKKLQSKYKPEELDPDLMYQNLTEQETSLPMEEKEELPFTTTKTAYDEKQPSESVSDTFNKAYNVWKKLQRECLNKGKRISPEEIGNFLNWAEKLEGFTNYDMEVMRNLIQETKN